MDCNCNLMGFSYLMIEKTRGKFQKVRITKCNILPIDGKKKKKCDFYNKEIVSTDVYCKKNVIIRFKPEIILNKDTSDEAYRKNITWNIHLCNISSISPILNKSKYYEMINYNLRKLNYKPFFEQTETLDELINRLKFPPDNIQKHRKLYTSKITTGLRKFATEETVESTNFYTGQYKSDEESNDSETESVKDTTFDVELYDSCEDDNNCDDEAFSD